jgi:hypothetical protein
MQRNAIDPAADKKLPVREQERRGDVERAGCGERPAAEKLFARVRLHHGTPSRRLSTASTS